MGHTERSETSNIKHSDRRLDKVRYRDILETTSATETRMSEERQIQLVGQQTAAGPSFLTPDTVTLLGVLSMIVLFIRSTVTLLNTQARSLGRVVVPTS